jgi:PGF-CTERM protein
MTYKTGTNVSSDIPSLTGFATVNPWAVVVKTGSGGKITVGLTTDGSTKDAVYTLRAEKMDSMTSLNNQLYDTVKVKVEKGAVTVTASGDGSYYLGEEVTYSGTNTDTNDVYMFITGPNLPSNGGVLTAPQTPVNTSAASADNTHETVKTDDTWEYKWDTSGLSLDAGTYTIYATSKLVNKNGLTNAKYDTISIVVKKPFVTATTSASTVAKGDKLYIRGTAEGNPTEGVAIWVLGKNYWNGAATPMANSQQKTETVNDDGSFEYELGTADTQNLAAGQYFVVVQHPMYNNKFDVVVDATTQVDRVFVKNQLSSAAAGTADNSQFLIWGNGKLQGSDAAEALIDAINSPDIDDTYYKLTFLVEEPWIRINSIGDHYVGDQFTITGTTNLAVGDDLIVEVTSSSFQPTQKSQSGEFSGASSTVQVAEGTTYNEWSMDVDASTFKPDEYIVKVEAIEADATATTTFNVLKGTTPTTAPTTAPTTGPTTVPTVAPTEQPTPKPTASPGFGALIALIGLGAVAALVLRKD